MDARQATKSSITLTVARFLSFLLILFMYFASVSFAQDSVSNQTQPEPILQDTFDQLIDTLPRRVYYHTYDPTYKRYVHLNDTLFAKNDVIRDSVFGQYTSDDYLLIRMAEKSAEAFGKNEYILKPRVQQWHTYLIILLVVFFVSIKNRYSKNLSLTFESYFNNRYISQFTRDDSFFRLRSSFLLLLFFVFTMAFFLYSAAGRLGWQLPSHGIQAYLIVTTFVFVYYIIRYQLLRLISFLFDFEKMMLSHVTILSVSNVVFAMVALPVMAVIPYVSDSVASALVIVLIVFWFINALFKYIRSGMFVVSNFQFPIFYLFVYLCTLEIAPLLFFVKLISDYA